jgi:hypothetical protein
MTNVGLEDWCKTPKAVPFKYKHSWSLNPLVGHNRTPFECRTFLWDEPPCQALPRTHEMLICASVPKEEVTLLAMARLVQPVYVVGVHLVIETSNQHFTVLQLCPRELGHAGCNNGQLNMSHALLRPKGEEAKEAHSTEEWPPVKFHVLRRMKINQWFMGPIEAAAAAAAHSESAASQISDSE